VDGFAPNLVQLVLSRT